MIKYNIPPVDLRAVCFVRAITCKVGEDEVFSVGYLVGSGAKSRGGRTVAVHLYKHDRAFPRVSHVTRARPSINKRKDAQPPPDSYIKGEGGVTYYSLCAHITSAHSTTSNLHLKCLDAAKAER